MKAILRMVIFALLAASQCVQAHSGDVVGVVNRLRARGGACAPAAPALVPRAMLDTAAAQLADGASLAAALKSAGYRMTETQTITLTGEGLYAQLETLLAGRFCAQIGMAALQDIGVYDGGNQVWILMAAPFAPKVELTPPQVAQRMLGLVNLARASPRRCGQRFFGAARPVRWNERLENAASLHAADMAANNYFSHTGHNGSTSAQRTADAGYSYRAMGENIAAGQPSPEEAVASWIRSPGHCANLMNRSFTEMGVAFAVAATSSMGVYWVQVFGAPG